MSEKHIKGPRGPWESVEAAEERNKMEDIIDEMTEACRLSEEVLAEHEQYDDDNDEPSREHIAAEACRAALINLQSSFSCEEKKKDV